MKVAILILNHNGKQLLSSYLEYVVAHKDDAEIFKGIVTEVILDENNQLIKDSRYVLM